MATGGNRQADIKRFFAVSLPKSTHVKRQISAVPHTGIDGGSERCRTAATKHAPPVPRSRAGEGTLLRGGANSGGEPKRQRLTGQSRATQSFLDLGQRDFGASRCAVCGMLYARGTEEDEALHRSFHSAALLGPRLQPWAGERVLLHEPGRGRLLMLRQADAGQHILKRVKEVCAFVERAQGLDDGWLLAPPEASAFLYVTPQHRVIALAVLEPAPRVGLSLCNTLASQRQQKQPQQQQQQNAGSSSRGEASPAQQQHAGVRRTPSPVLGVRMVWVSSEHRRRGLASKMLDAARCELIPGYCVPRAELAFSSPTADGEALAQALVRDVFCTYVPGSAVLERGRT